MTCQRTRTIPLLLVLLLVIAGTAEAAINLVPSAARTASGNSGVLTSGNISAQPTLVERGVFILDVTAAATEVGDTLDVYVQSSYDGGATWDDFIHFTQVVGTGGAKKFLAHWVRGIAPTTALKAPQDGALTAGVQQGPVGPAWRVKWVIVDAVTNGNQSFTFSVSLEPGYGGGSP